MNDQLTAIINGKKPYVVINDRLMIRSIDGKLDNVPSAQITVTSYEACNVDDSQSKNVNSRGQVVSFDSQSSQLN